MNYSVTKRPSLTERGTRSLVPKLEVGGITLGA